MEKRFDVKIFPAVSLKIRYPMRGEDEANKLHKAVSLSEIWEEIRQDNLIGILEFRADYISEEREGPWCVWIIAPDAEYIDGIIHNAIPHYLHSIDQDYGIGGEYACEKHLNSVGISPEKLKEILERFSLSELEMLNHINYLKERIAGKRFVWIRQLLSEMEMFAQCGLTDEVTRFWGFVEDADPRLSREIEIMRRLPG